MRALMGAGLGGISGLPDSSDPPLPRIGNGTTHPPLDTSQPGGEDPMMQLMSSFMGGGQPGMEGQPGPFPGMMNMPMSSPAPPKPKTLLQKVLPLVHILLASLLLVYCVLWMEPAAHGDGSGHWSRWHELRRDAGQWGWSLKTVVSF
jgi:hypothetical protein